MYAHADIHIDNMTLTQGREEGESIWYFRALLYKCQIPHILVRDVVTS